MLTDHPKRTDLSELGEFGLIQHLTKDFQIQSKNTIKGIGDDAAVLARDEQTYGLLSSDLLAEGIHFDLSYVPLKHLGYKAVVVNLSDIYAMNGIPEQVVISVAVSNRFSVEAMEELYSGIRLACETYGVDLAGGDTTSSRAGLIVNVAVYGVANKNTVVYRAGAKYQDLIVVSGDLGAAYLGLQVLEREKAVYKENPNVQPDLDGYDYILMRQLKPEARKDIIEKLASQDVVPSSMIDISDGLASELIHLSKASGCGMRVYADKIPIDEAAALVAEEFNLDPITCALNGGEDYELLMTVPMAQIDKVNSIPSLKIIGHVTAEGAGVEMAINDDQIIELKAQGWKHF